MKKYLLLSIFIAFSMFASNAQERDTTFMQRISFDASAAYNLPVSSSFKDFKGSDYAGFRNFNFGANYAINNLWGLRFTYGYNSFEDKNDSSMGLTLHKLMAEGTFNILRSINMQENPFEIVGHAGAGVSFGKSSVTSGLDKMGTFQVGLMPMYRISKNLSLFVDATYVVNISQNYGFNGQSAMDKNGSATGEYSFINLAAGLRLNF